MLNKRKGQLQIAETLVSVTLMLALALLLISAANQLTSPSTDFTYLNQTAEDILATADELGLLRPCVYLFGSINYDDAYILYQDALIDYIKVHMPPKLGYALICHEIIDGSTNPSYFTIIGTSADILAYQGDAIVVANYHLGSFSSSEFGLFDLQYLVQLFIWEKI